MLFPIILHLSLIFALLMAIREISKESKLYDKRCILIIGTLIIVNIYFTYNYTQIKSSHNINTFTTYKLTIDSMRDISYDDIDDIEDIWELTQTIGEIQKHNNSLIRQMNYSNIVSREERAQFKSSLNNLSSTLEEFLREHNHIFARGEEINANQFEKYDMLKSELLNFLGDFDSGGRYSSNRFGVEEHQIIFSGNHVARLEKTVEKITEIVDKLVLEIRQV